MAFFWAIYASPTLHKRLHLWNQLEPLASEFNVPWLVMGVFNELLDSNDKLGGRPLLSSRVQAFHSCLTTCGLLELATSGPKCTWANKHSDWRCHFRERLDRAFHNAAWQLLFPKAHCLTLPRFHSDHHPIIASTEGWETAAPQKHFFFPANAANSPTFSSSYCIVLGKP